MGRDSSAGWRANALPKAPTARCGTQSSPFPCRAALFACFYSGRLGYPFSKFSPSCKPLHLACQGVMLILQEQKNSGLGSWANRISSLK